jgi:tetratricopeptide (TPR) repeat protein
MEERLNRLIALPEAQVATAAASFAEPETLLLTFTATNLEMYPSGQLLYAPLPITAKEIPATIFAQAEAAEFQQKDYVRAIAALRALARLPDPTIRAGALLRLARNLRKAGQAQAALAAYDELAQLQTTLIEGYPARLLAQYGRCVLLQELSQLPPPKAVA